MGETFIIPEAKIQDDTKYITGTDGEKMSKSKNNIIDIFVDDKTLRKQIMKIETHSLSVEDPKNPEECNVFKLYEVVASTNEIEQLKKQYLKGGIGYGESKELLYDKILNRFSENREKYFDLLQNRFKVEDLLSKGSKKARVQAQKVLKRVRSRRGF